MPFRGKRSAVAAVLFGGLGALILGARPAGAQSENMTLLGHRDAYPYHSGVWGYTHTDGTELAIIGTETGTSFVNVTNPGTPTEVAFIPGPSSGWREFRTHGTYCYISNESGGGIQIVNMANPLLPVLAGTYATGFSTCHSLNYDEQTGFLYLNGTNNGMIILDLANPLLPDEVGIYGDRYVHDCYVRDGICYVAAIFDGALLILDVSDPGAIQELAFEQYSGGATHNMWLTEDSRYLYTTDETTAGHIRVWDVLDPSNPTQVGTGWSNPEEPNSSVHNVVIRGDFAYVSWYTAGVQVLDISTPTVPDRAGYYDTYPGTGTFDGDWGVYPGLASGHVVISDMSTGLYIFEFESNFGTLQGTVRDADTSEPLEGVTVTVPALDRTTTTNDQGFYKMNLAPAVYDVDFELFGYDPQAINVTITPGVITTRDIDLELLPSGSISGVVKAAIGGTPIQGATVALLSTPLTTSSAANGTYSIPTVPDGSYTARATKFGFAPRSYVVDVVAGQDTPRIFSLTPSFFADNVETNQGWTLGAPGDNASSGIWVRADPVGTGGGGVQPEDDHTEAPGVTCFVTGNCTPGCGIGDNDVDGGRTTLLSPIFNLATVTDPRVRYWRWYTNNAGGNPNSDTWQVDVSSNNGTTWINLESTTVTSAFWDVREFTLSSYITLTSQVRFRFIASDLGGGSIVEAAVDDFELYSPTIVTDVPESGLAAQTRLLGATPNPFRASTALGFQLASRQPVLLDILDVQGRQLRRLVDRVLDAGSHQVPWDGRDDLGRPLAHGVYFQRLVTAGKKESAKVLLVR